MTDAVKSAPQTIASPNYARQVERVIGGQSHGCQPGEHG